MLKTLIKSLFPAALVAGSLCTTTQAQTTSGFSPDNVAQVDVLPGWRTASGTHMTALRVQLAPGWKTYWRAPGASGIPPRFDWEDSQNLSAVRFHWPTPNVWVINGMRTLGYEDQLILPMELTPQKSGYGIAMRAKVELGVCEDICVPITVDIAADLTSAGASDPLIRSAIAAVPDNARAAGLRGVTCQAEPISDGLRLTAQIAMPALGQGEIAVVELPDQTIWVSEPVTQRSGGVLKTVADMVPANNKPFVLDRSQVRITVLGAGRAVDILGCTAG